MATLEVLRRMGPDDVAAVSGLLELVEDAEERQALSDHQRLDLTHGGRAGFAAFVARQPGHDHPVAYAQLTRHHRTWGVELVVSPHHRDETERIGAPMLAAALDVVRSEGGGTVQWWVYRPTATHERLATRLGLRLGRRLLQLRVPLPLDVPSTLETRPFRPGRDETAWLQVNNRAFASHPEQGHWTPEMLRAREAEPWFDPAGFLLHEVDGRLAGFCWTKVHDEPLPVGEIYVIAVDPDFHGTGLGRALTVAGLDHLARLGLPTGMLYVDADNDPAVALYRSLGFTVHHEDRAYVADVGRHVPPPPDGSAA